MYSKLTYFSFIIFSWLLVSVSCKDKTKAPYCTENPGNCQSVLVAKDFFLFKVGSWWVYEEETTHERDSMYVFESVNGESYNFNVNIHSQLSGYNYGYYPSYVSYGSCNESNPIQGKCIFINRSKGELGNHIGEGYCFFVNYKVGDNLGTFNNDFPNNKIKVIQILSSFDIGNLHFEKTVKINEDATVIESDQETNHYYSEGVGLIRKELLGVNQVWNLVSYHIEP